MDIRKLNDESSYLDWDEWQYDYWEMFDESVDFSACEIYLAREYLNMMHIDIDQKEIITFKAAPVHFAHMIVKFIRHMESENPENFSQNFCRGIDDHI